MLTLERFADFLSVSHFLILESNYFADTAGQ